MDKKYCFDHLKKRKPDLLKNKEYLKSSVILPLIEFRNKICLLFEIRAKNLRRQPGEICFPGGKINPTDYSPAQAALRETCEELGLTEKDIKIIGPLDYLVTPYNNIIYPFLGQIVSSTSLSPNPDEVEDIIYIPLDYLYATSPLHHQVKIKLIFPDNFPFDLIPNGKNYDWKEGTYDEYFYNFNDHIIWGVTAQILHHFISLTQK